MDCKCTEQESFNIINKRLDRSAKWFKLLTVMTIAELIIGVIK